MNHLFNLREQISAYTNALEYTLRLLSTPRLRSMQFDEFGFCVFPRQSGLGQFPTAFSSLFSNIDVATFLSEKAPHKQSSYLRPPKVKTMRPRAESPVIQTSSTSDYTLPPTTKPNPTTQAHRIFDTFGNDNTNTSIIPPHTLSPLPPIKRQPASPHYNSTSNPQIQSPKSSAHFFAPNVHLPTPTPKPRKPRKPRPRETLWASQYRYLTKHTSLHPHQPLHRNDTNLHTLWQTHYSTNPLYAYSSRTRLRAQRRRQKFILAQQRVVARSAHCTGAKLARRKRRWERLYRVAYLEFKRARFGMFERFGVLGSVYRMGWTAQREWVAWKRLGRGGGRRDWRAGRRRVRERLVLDEVQAEAERRIFEIRKEKLDERGRVFEMIRGHRR